MRVAVGTVFDAGGVMMRRLIDLVAALCVVAGIAHTAAAQDSARVVAAGGRVAPDAAQVVAEGNRWLQSSPEERKAFIIGASNMMALESAYAKKKGTPSPLAGTRAAAALEHMTLDQISDRITRWYQVNPGRRTMPVIAVVWTELVEPDTTRK
jgi:hypothetical protein